MDCQKALEDEAIALVSRTSRAGWNFTEIYEVIDQLTLARRWARDENHRLGVAIQVPIWFEAPMVKNSVETNKMPQEVLL